MKKYSVVIIGSGIAGMTSGIYLKRAGINPLIIEKSSPGGQLNKSFVIENYPGYNSITGPELAYNIYKQVKDLEIEYLYDDVINVDFENKVIKTKEHTICYDYLIIASGRSPRKLEFGENSKISYCAVCDGALYKNKDVMVLGGGNSALEESLYLSGLCSSVTLVHRKHKFSGEDNLVKRVEKTPNINIYYNEQINGIDDDGDKLKVNLINKKESVSALFVCIGYAPSTYIYNLAKDNDYIIVNDKMETSIPGVYACGDIIKKSYYQLTTAAGEATVCASEIVKKISSDKCEN